MRGQNRSPGSSAGECREFGGGAGDEAAEAVEAAAGTQLTTTPVVLTALVAGFGADVVVSTLTTVFSCFSSVELLGPA